MVGEVTAFGVSGDVLPLIVEVFTVADAVFVVAWMPDFAFELVADGVGEAAFDVLNAACERVLWQWGDEDVGVVGHDGEGVELVAVLIAVVEQEFQHHVGVCGAGEQGSALMGDEGDGVGLHNVWRQDTRTGSGCAGVPRWIWKGRRERASSPFPAKGCFLGIPRCQG